ncbi:carbohydrate ABC transporter membrane protein 1, CUT1 family [Austwickia chelonae]|uniref:Putative ABC transporter permease protein n=1 Tax=Austwickia chelonae NBRC 105200 TaxID=1184607 RepID=K6VRI8_9MICO|nr:sugar ABC transporter permease [Austwickia chelonae]GAB77970.1 putative ABC transporter permease protein [Austwickia chelonae NBRC 105200]SEV93335.1 carbohydrate ABC transporter membrane protein 1, CUT1 family [Austwickia chelonae]
MGIRQRRWTGLWYVAPSLIVITVVAIAPMVMSAGLSFSDYSGFDSPRFTGAANYEKLLDDPHFSAALVNTAIFTLIAVPLQTVIPMGIAALLVDTRWLLLNRMVRSVLFVPVVASLVLVGTVWQYMLAPGSGFFNTVLRRLGLASINFLGDPNTALFCVALVSVWKNLGYFLVIFYAGILDIPRELYEAAQVDGAGGWRQFLHITVPGLRPVVFLVTVLSTIWSFQVFDLVYAMTGGGPGGATSTIVMAVYESAYKSFDMGYASAMAMVLLMIIAAASAAQHLFFRRRDR